MKGVKYDVRTKKAEYVDDGLPFPSFPPLDGKVEVDLSDIKKIIDFAKSQGWI